MPNRKGSEATYHDDYNELSSSHCNRCNIESRPITLQRRPQRSTPRSTQDVPSSPRTISILYSNSHSMDKKHEATLQANMMLSRDEDDLVQYDKEWVEHKLP
jgi:hypothetical protein